MDGDKEIPRINAPFTDEQVEALKAYQAGPLHSYTCDEYHGHDHEVVLVPATDGLICPEDPTHIQTWADATEFTNGLLEAAESFLAQHKHID